MELKPYIPERQTSCEHEILFGGEGMETYKLDPIIAQRIIDLMEGQNGCFRHSQAAMAMRVIGLDCQITGRDLHRAAAYTLGLPW